ncbi:hypothetical protein M9H77_30357 [Catharanthus roseus]|uniref:Uncharacterized protein n=1 Tax=Catharanthus roseus TaxID=4058 RepID=A0ACB9ZX09_CATRO|nr:hypothetical protein M9H77_30357 [Catharanthus roseus]
MSAQFLHPEFKRICCNSGAPWRKSGSSERGHWNQVPGSHSRYQPNTIRALDYKQLHSHITVQNKLQTPGEPTRPRPQGTTPLFKWIHPQSQNPSTSSEEALVQGTSHYNKTDFVDSPEYRSGTRILQM